MQKIDLDQGGEGLEKVPGDLAGQVGGGRVGDADLQVVLLTSSNNVSQWARSWRDNGLPGEERHVLLLPVQETSSRIATRFLPGR